MKAKIGYLVRDEIDPEYPEERRIWQFHPENEYREWSYGKECKKVVLIEIEE